jgi:hypothetical protein
MTEDEIFKDLFDGFGTDGDLAQWVNAKCQAWRDHYESNYSEKHEEYYRIFRNQWSKQDQERQSERSRLIAPATAQAVESNVAEIEEATFGRGKLFDIKDAHEMEANPQAAQQIAYLKKKLHEDFGVARVRSSVAEVLINAAVYGTGIAEVVIDEVKVYAPATQPTMDGLMNEVGVNETYRPLVKMNPIQPKNFLVDPAATCIDEALGCAVDEFVSRHIVEELQESGIYRDDVFVGDSAADEEIEFDSKIDSKPKDRVRLTKYYGKVPRAMLLEEPGVDAEDLEPGHYVEAIVVLANGTEVLKAMANPYMCQDRPIVAFQWDVVPSIFWGRGVCEKAYMSQKALDAELRARIDALALTTHPMMAVDATRIPRGHKLEVRPGRMLMTNGNPGEALMPLKFGAVDQITFAQGQQLQAMVSQATGAGDGAPAQGGGDVTAAGQSMSQGAVVKRQKRTLVNFQENFLIPFIRKAAYRYMQFDPENYPVQDYTFIPFSSLGAMAREYEVAQLSQILQMVGPESPAHAAIIKGIIDHLNVSNRDELIAAIDAANQPNPEAEQQAQQQQQEAHQMQMAIQKGQVALLEGQAAESQSRAQKYATETQLMPEELTLKYAEDMDEKEFQKKKQMSELLLKEQELQIKQDASANEAMTKSQEAQMRQQLMRGAGSGSTNSTSTPAGPPAAGI